MKTPLIISVALANSSGERAVLLKTKPYSPDRPTVAVTVWARHKQIQGYYQHTLVSKDLKSTSTVATCFGLFSAFGLFLVGNFQVRH